MNKIAFFRKTAGLSQAKLAALIGRCQGAIGNYESERRGVDVETARRIICAICSQGIQCTFDDVFPIQSTSETRDFDGTILEPSLAKDAKQPITTANGSSLAGTSSAKDLLDLKDHLKEKFQKEKTASSNPTISSDRPQAFIEFFQAYPAHRKGGTDGAAWKAWLSENLSPDDARFALEWIKKAADNSPCWETFSQDKYIPGITKFIRERRWLTPLPKPPNRQPPDLLDSDDDIEWVNDLGI